MSAVCPKLGHATLMYLPSFIICEYVILGIERRLPHLPSMGNVKRLQGGWGTLEGEGSLRQLIDYNHGEKKDITPEDN